MSGEGGTVSGGCNSKEMAWEAAWQDSGMPAALGNKKSVAADCSGGAATHGEKREAAAQLAVWQAEVQAGEAFGIPSSCCREHTVVTHTY
jgi:hypothetical protein